MILPLRISENTLILLLHRHKKCAFIRIGPVSRINFDIANMMEQNFITPLFSGDLSQEKLYVKLNDRVVTYASTQFDFEAFGSIINKDIDYSSKIRFVPLKKKMVGYKQNLATFFADGDINIYDRSQIIFKLVRYMERYPFDQEQADKNFATLQLYSKLHKRNKLYAYFNHPDKIQARIEQLERELYKEGIVAKEVDVFLLSGKDRITFEPEEKNSFFITNKNSPTMEVNAAINLSTENEYRLVAQQNNEYRIVLDAQIYRKSIDIDNLYRYYFKFNHNEGSLRDILNMDTIYSCHLLDYWQEQIFYQNQR